MYKVYKSIQESFDKSFDVKSVPEGKIPFSFPGLDKYYFKVSDDLFYVIFYAKNLIGMADQWNNFRSKSLNRGIEIYSIDFLRVINPNDSWNFNNLSQDKIETSNAISVFSTVIKHAIQFLKNKKFDIVTLSGKESENRGRLYNKMAKKFASIEDATVLGVKPISYMGDSFESSVIMKNELYNSLDSEVLQKFLKEFNIHND